MEPPFQGVDAPSVQIFPRGGEGRAGREGDRKERKGNEREWRERTKLIRV